MCPEEEEEEDPQEEEKFTTEQARILASRFQKGTPADRLRQLKILRRMMGMDISYINAFLSVNNSMKALISQLTGSDAAVQVAASGCIVNISAGTSNHCDIALKSAAVYLVSFLDGQNSLLKDHCCCALGNMAANGSKSQEILQQMGVLTPLVNIIMTSAYDVNLMQSALFALANLLKNEKICLSFPSIDSEFITRLLHFSQSQMVTGVSSGIRLDVCRLLFHLSARQDKHMVLLSAGVFTQLTVLLIEYVRDRPEDYIKIITPLIRCLGNLGCQHHESVTMATQDGHLVASIFQLLQTATLPFYLQKEVLWMISNLTASSSVVSHQCIENNLHILLTQQLLSKPPDIQRESIICIHHLLSTSPDIVMVQLIDAGILPKISELLRRLEEPTLQCLNLLDSLLCQSPEVRRLCEENNIISVLDSLVMGDDDEVRMRAGQIKDTHWENW
ncbi:hypothetical protein BSL78_06274 [Apostichopus japonicus]|uniref:Armadillo repeat-containing protein 8 n=1 Tax=Stichopus japonicus TaxID=307972 RepID=A0A2G8L9C3_STIJA|nr:hypothetical protein BSL78_06274 [Apostichopus japonicus]